MDGVYPLLARQLKQRGGEAADIARMRQNERRRAVAEERGEALAEVHLQRRARAEVRGDGWRRPVVREDAVGDERELEVRLFERGDGVEFVVVGNRDVFKASGTRFG